MDKAASLTLADILKLINRREYRWRNQAEDIGPFDPGYNAAIAAAGEDRDIREMLEAQAA